MAGPVFAPLRIRVVRSVPKVGVGLVGQPADLLLRLAFRGKATGTVYPVTCL